MTVPLFDVTMTVVNLHVFKTWLASSMRDAGDDNKLKAYTWPSSPAEHSTLWSTENISWRMGPTWPAKHPRKHPQHLSKGTGEVRR
jgi:hypothetical protein